MFGIAWHPNPGRETPGGHEDETRTVLTIR